MNSENWQTLREVEICKNRKTNSWNIEQNRKTLETHRNIKKETHGNKLEVKITMFVHPNFSCGVPLFWGINPIWCLCCPNINLIFDRLTGKPGKQLKGLQRFCKILAEQVDMFLVSKMLRVVFLDPAVEDSEESEDDEVFGPSIYTVPRTGNSCAGLFQDVPVWPE